jgi:DNA-directed RNA polymerase
MAETHLDYDTLVHSYGQELVDKQVALEERMIGLGNEAFHRRINKARQSESEGNTGYGSALLAHSITPVADAIRAFIEEAQSGKPGRRHIAVRYLTDTDPEVAALLTLRAILDGITTRRSMQTVAIGVASRIESEHRYRALAESGSWRKKLADKKIKEQPIFERKALALAKYLQHSGVEWQPWPAQDRLHLGIKLIELVMESVGLVETVDLSDTKHRTKKYLTVTAKTLEWIERQIGRCEMLTPVNLPTLIPPRDWTDPTSGGYHTNAIPTIPFVKNAKTNYIEELRNRWDEMPMVHGAVNAIQRTPWRINKPILEVAKHLWDSGAVVANLPDRVDIEHVQCPVCHAAVPLGAHTAGRRKKWNHPCLIEDKEALKQWKKDAAMAHELNVAIRSRRVQVLKTIWCAEMFADADRIFMPYNLDFRARIYAIPFFNPQGFDLMKGLLTFADAKPITDGVAAGWLAIHGANVFGEDKISLEDRISWVEERNEMIQAIAEDPIENLQWTLADKPFQFLAFCFEWAGFLAEGYGYMSHLPVALDGTCSGIQHLSAMVRDPVGGAAVNLVPADKPADIYGQVAEVVVAQLRLASSRGGEDKEVIDQLLAIDIDRKATKRQTMTLPYGSTRYSCRDYTEEWFYKEREDRLPWDKKGTFHASLILTDFIWDGIGEVVVRAREVMGWLQDCAKVVAKEGLPITWTTPVGFPVVQHYKDFRLRRVKSKMGDSIIKLSLKEELDTIDKSRMASAISPNFVHSMDAAHLSWSVAYASNNGVTHYAMIHDSFGTHAADAEMMGACLRRAFVDMYQENNVLEQFRASLASLVEDDSDIPPAPKMGTLDLECVLESDFFFG